METLLREKLLIVMGTISGAFCVTVKAVVRCLPAIVTTDVRLFVEVLAVQEMVMVCVLAPELGLIDSQESAAGTVITQAQLAFTTTCFSPPSDSMVTLETSIRSELTTTSGVLESPSPPPQESNSIIKTYEKEISLLRNKNDNLENNLKILTKSHTELEKIINSNTSGLKTELDIKEQKYNDILKELSIKNIHIKSLEKIIENQNKPTPGKIFTKIEAIPANFEENKYKTINDNFISNKYEEIKLNKLINGYERNNKVNEFYKNENNINIENNNNNVDINDLIKFSGGNQ